MAKPIKNEAPQENVDNILDDLGEISEHLRESTEYIKLLMLEFEDYEDFYGADNIEEFERTIMGGKDAIERVITEIDEELITARKKLSVKEKELFRKKIQVVIQNIETHNLLLGYYLIDTLKKFAPEKNEPTTIHIKKDSLPLYIPNKIVSPKQMTSFVKACGVEENPDKSKGDHIGLIDPEEEMKPTGYDKTAIHFKHFKNLVKHVYEAGLPLERIIKALKKEKIAFRIKK